MIRRLEMDLRGGTFSMTAVIGMIILSLTLSGCLFSRKKPTGGDTASVTPTPTPAPAASDDFGKLTGVRYESSGGSMECNSEFDIDVNENEIVSTYYYSNYYFDDLEYELGEKKLAKIDGVGRVDEGKYSWDKNRVDRKNVPVDEKLWNVLVEEFGYLKPKLKEIPEFTKEDSHKRDEEMEVLDGGDYSLLHLTWEKDGTTYTAQYQIPAGNRWSTVIYTLHEMVRPVGRDLRQVGPTQVTDMLLKTLDYSYQISPIKDENDKYNFYIHEDKYTYKRLSGKQWSVIRSYIETVDLSETEKGRYDDKLYLKLQYNDGDCFYYLIDRKTADEIKEYIISLKY